jgi:DNA-directed RNA polymerase subunit omega
MIKENDLLKLQEMKDELTINYRPTAGNRFGDYVFSGDLEGEKESKPVQKNTDGLRYPSIDNLLGVVDSKYKLAYIAAKRAKIIKKDEYSSVDNRCVKPVGKALEEILAKKVTAKF